MRTAHGQVRAEQVLAWHVLLYSLYCSCRRIIQLGYMRTLLSFSCADPVFVTTCVPYFQWLTSIQNTCLCYNGRIIQQNVVGTRLSDNNARLQLCFTSQNTMYYHAPICMSTVPPYKHNTASPWEKRTCQPKEPKSYITGGRRSIQTHVYTN
jgi:hypothetical protein